MWLSLKWVEVNVFTKMKTLFSLTIAAGVFSDEPKGGHAGLLPRVLCFGGHWMMTDAFPENVGDILFRASHQG